MRRTLMKYGLATGMLVVGLGLGGAEASVNKPIPPESLGISSAVTPAAMCGSRSCRRSFYIPGPPGVCFARGLHYCGSSGGGGGRPGIDCRELRRACLFRDELGERGRGNCRRYRELCEGGGRFGGGRF